MGAKTEIQWCDSTVNPIMGCAGCELFPSPAKMLAAIDAAVTKELPSWKTGEAKRVYQAFLKEEVIGSRRLSIRERIPANCRGN
jgi:protein gp37